MNLNCSSCLGLALAVNCFGIPRRLILAVVRPGLGIELPHPITPYFRLHEADRIVAKVFETLNSAASYLASALVVIVAPY